MSEPRDCSRVCHVIDLSAVELLVQLQQWATRLRLYFLSLSTTAVAKTRQSSTHAKLSRKRDGISYLPSKGVHCLHAARTQVPLRFFGASGVGPGVGARLDRQISECLHNFSTAHYAFSRSRSLGQQDLRLLLRHRRFQVRSTSSRVMIRTRLFSNASSSCGAENLTIFFLQRRPPARSQTLQRRS